jgi:hypothetical protein
MPNDKAVRSLLSDANIQQPNLKTVNELLPLETHQALDFQPTSAQEDWPMASSGIDTYDFQNYAWIYSEESLNDLYSMSFLDSTAIFDSI